MSAAARLWFAATIWAMTTIAGRSSERTPTGSPTFFGAVEYGLALTLAQAYPPFAIDHDRSTRGFEGRSGRFRHYSERRTVS
jgi:hypothetical protein